MAKNNLCEDNELVAGCEDEEMVAYRKKALNVITFRIVLDNNDLETANKKTNSFKPEMAHQIFGDSELIFGYRQLSIVLYYLHNSAKCYAKVKAADHIVHDLYKADDIMKLLQMWLPKNYRENEGEFRTDIAEEDHAVIHGEVVHTFENHDKTYKVTLCDATNEQFKEFHQRFETYIMWFIDGANFIDLDDCRWTIFYVYEEYVDAETDRTIRSPVGFCTVYKFFLYPNSTRPRISQFFILPTHQRRGIGSKLYSAVYNYLKDLPESRDITVEEPTAVFQKIRDFCDSVHIHEALKREKINVTVHNQKQIGEFLKQHKISKKQAQRVFDILECVTTRNRGFREYTEYTESIKRRIKSEIERENLGSKRICNAERAVVMPESLDVTSLTNAEYGRYMESLEGPVRHMTAYLQKNSAE
ncbi:hypothetical protein MTP99_009086 [Tenebrio molitor]|jgi:histone acetyltransferase 1|uniref:histone acetyltransferase n=2 Tax=Tenebrio molitor TaxID=7067 RepID=A0A8J6HL57_TENMO|nr:hypothetical protein GEV33_006492 [Tenebrio molitor]KAJ3617088.1 hypothetical protein MTP99_009086 [Tenebrio molitor]